MRYLLNRSEVCRWFEQSPSRSEDL